MTTSVPSIGKLPKLPSMKGSGMPRSNAEKLWMAGGALAAVLIVLIGYVTLISHQQSQTSAVQQQITAARQHNAGLQSQITSLQAQSRNIGTYKAELAKAQLALPSSADASNFLRSMQALGVTTGTTVTSLTNAAPAAVAATSAAAPASGSASAAPASPAAGGAAAPAQLYSMAISASVTGSATGVAEFLKQLQSVQPRAVLVTAVTESAAQTVAGGHNGAITVSLTMTAFVAPTNITVPSSAASPSAAPSSGS